jgi:hypothetical protein
MRGPALVLLVTHAGLPELTDDDRLLADALRERGLRAAPAVWDDPAVDWSVAALAVLRSTWDYHRRLAAFLAWLDRAGQVTRVVNAPALVRWNAHKGYLRELAVRGLPTVPTEWLARGTRATLAEVKARRGWSDLVVKPAVSASAWRTRRFGDDAAGQGERHLAELLRDVDVMVQPYLSTLDRAGETALMFVDGRFTHAVRRPAALVAGAHRQLEGEPVKPGPAALDLGRRVLDVLGTAPPYARVDVVEQAEPLLLELELIEPTLYLDESPVACAALAESLLKTAARAR